jgi:uncharacterized protein (DUF608 family)
MATMKGLIQHTSGIPLGGIGTGSIEIRPDGYFHEWQIFNLGPWAPRQPECCRTEGPPMPPGALALHVWAKQGGAAPVVRRLGVRSDQHDMYNLTWLKSVREIQFTGRFPAATLRYLDDDLPVSVVARMFSPFVPHDSETSGTPGFYAVFRVKNTSPEPVEVSLAAVLRNPLAWGDEDRQLKNTISRDGATTLLTMRTRAKAACQATLGSLGLSVTGGKASWMAGEFADYVSGTHIWDDCYGIVHECFLHGFRATGRLPSLPGNQSPAALVLPKDDQIDVLPPAEKKRLVGALLRYPFARALYDRIAFVDRKHLAGNAGLGTFLKAIRRRLDRMAGQDRRRQAWGDGALASTVTLAPQEEKEIAFTLGWHFPYHFSERGPVLGHMYENWFADAEEVNRFLAAHREGIQARALGFADALHETTLDPLLADAWAGQLTTLAKCTWWTKAGDFAVWEGLGCCGFHTTDITYQGSFNILALFPDLQKRQMELGAKFQRADGRVHHFFTPDLSAVDNGFDRVDMNQQFVLLTARDYLWTGDREHLRRQWPHVVRAMENTSLLDADGDGLPDHDTRRNTYDAWSFFGTPSYIASLWLSALLAAARLAEDLGRRAQAARWRKVLRRGIASFEKKLWNGEYYSLWVDGKDRDECCMTDQIDGEWFTSLIGLGGCLPRERIVAALGAVMRYNFSPEDGLRNATYPPRTKPRLSTYQNLQAMAPWTGIEYAIGSMMFDFGLVAEGWAVVRNIHERYLRAGRYWNHVECGDHYYRAMSSWAILLGVTGFKIDVPRGVVTFAPAIAGADLTAPWVSATGWGTFRRTPDSFALFCDSGEIEFKELRLNIPASRTMCVHLNDKHLTVSIGEADGLTIIRVRKPITVGEGDALVVG